MAAPDSLKTKEQLREYLAGAELQEVLRQTLSTILKRDELPSPDELVRTLGEELVSMSEEADAAESQQQDEAEAEEAERAKMAARRGGGRRTGVSAESTNSMKEAEKPTAQKTEKTEEQKARISAAIAGNLLFEGIEGAQQEELFSLMFERTVEPGTNVITQGEEGDNFYVVDSGACDVVVNGSNVGVCKNGDSFGELALMYFAPRAATITATETTTLWAMDRITFRSMLFDRANEKREQYKQFLNSVPLLEPMEPYEREKIADVLESVAFADGQEVIKEGSEGDAFYIVEEGSAVASKLVDGQQKDVKTYSSGDFFGELALVQDQPRAATVVAKGELKCVMLGRKPFTRLVGTCADILQRNQDLYEEVNAQLDGVSAPPTPPPVRPWPLSLTYELPRRYGTRLHPGACDACFSRYVSPSGFAHPPV